MEDIAWEETASNLSKRRINLNNLHVTTIRVKFTATGNGTFQNMSGM
jgi:hypothetical protein